MAQIEKEQHFDFSKVEMQELLEILPHCLTEQFNLARTADMTMTDNTVTFKATGILYESLYRAPVPLKSVNLFGCPVVSAVASALAKTSGKTVVIKELVLSPNNWDFQVMFNFM